jgi:hypothetical protein
VLPSIKDIVNKSLSEQCVQASFKQAIVRPLLKKPNLDKETKLSRMGLIFPKTIHKTCQPELFHHGAKEE